MRSILRVTDGIMMGRSGQVTGFASVTRPKSLEDHESHKALAASATSEVTSLESSYARIFRDDTALAEPTTSVVEDHGDVPQAASL